MGYAVLEKSDHSPVTVADYGSQALICRMLREAFPGDAIVAEEDAAALREPSQRRTAAMVLRHIRDVRKAASLLDVLQWIDFGQGHPDKSRFWTLDPIDGTKGFLRGQQYAIALALIEDGEVRTAALACPNLGAGLMLGAERGKGAWCQALHGDGAQQRIRASATKEITQARICESVEAGHSAHGDAHRLAQHLGIGAEASVRLDSQAKYAVVARGEADIYLRLPTRPGYQERIWDHAAGSLILAEARGVVTDIYGNALDFSKGRTLVHNKGVVATNGWLHAAVVKAIADLGIGT